MKILKIFLPVLVVLFFNFYFGFVPNTAKAAWIPSNPLTPAIGAGGNGAPCSVSGNDCRPYFECDGSDNKCHAVTCFINPCLLCGGACTPYGGCGAYCSCGNGVCDNGETFASCPQDCAAYYSCASGSCQEDSTCEANNGGPDSSGNYQGCYGDSTCSGNCNNNNNNNNNNAPCTNTSPGQNKMQGCLWGDQNLGGTGNNGSGAGNSDQLGNAPTEAQASGNADTFSAIYETSDPSGKSVGSNYSERWQGTFNFSGGTYTFTTGSDDGDALYIDGNYVTGYWFDRGCNLSYGQFGQCTDTASVNLSIGPHTIKYEYYQNGGGAQATVSWAQTSGPPPSSICNSPSSWILCAAENGNCSFSGTKNVKYGVLGGDYISQTFFNGVSCSNTVFYPDPDPGVAKSCWVCATAPSPTISLSPSSMSFSGVSNGNTPTGQTLTVSDPVSGTTLNWKVTTDQTWCHASPASGTAPNGSPSSVTVTMDSPSNTGIFTCNVTVSDNGSNPAAGNSPQGIVATYTVQPSDACSGSGCGSCSGGLCSGGSGSNGVSAGGAVCPATGIVLTWLAAQGTAPVTYNIYRNTTDSAPSAGNLLAVSPVSGTSYADPITSGGPYYYWVQSISGGQTSPDKAAANTNSSGTSPNTCSGGGNVNMLTSDKDIVAINGNPVLSSGNQPPQSCNATTDILPVDNNLNIGDVLTFQISLCNTGTDPAAGITVNDVMVSLQQYSGNWNAKYNGQPLTYDGTTNSGLANHYHVTGTSPNQTLVFNLTSSADNVAVNSAGTLTYNAQLFAPQDTSGNIGRFSNQFTVWFNPSQSVARATPLLPFSLGKGIPTIREIP